MDEAGCYIASLSARTIAYKGMVMPESLAMLYPDLADGRLRSTAAVFHQRFSTNTLPRWELAQPFRLLAHNGEINTIRGNRNWTRARRRLLASPVLAELENLDPPVSLHGSDSCSLDNMLELLVAGGMPLPQAVRICIPPPGRLPTTSTPICVPSTSFSASTRRAGTAPPAWCSMTAASWSARSTATACGRRAGR